MSQFRNLAEDATIEIYLDTIDSTGAPVAPSSAFVASDFAIYKNGSATAKATTNGITVTSPFNSETGTHLLIIDTSNDTGDAGFWTTGARYQVKFNTSKTVGGISIDGRKVRDGAFGIQSEYMRGTENAALASGVSVTSIGANVITAASIATDAGTEIGAAVLSALGTGSWATAIPWNAAWDAEVQSECADALNAYDPPTKAELDTAIATVPSAGGIADAVWDEARTGHTTAGTFGFYLDAAISGISGGGGGVVNVLPATGIVADRSAGATLNPVVGETISQSISVYQSDGTTAVDLSGKTLNIIFETMSGVDVAVVQTANITISGTDDNIVTFAYPSAVTASERSLRFAIRDAAAPLTMYLQGVCSVVAAPKVDA